MIADLLVIKDLKLHKCPSQCRLCSQSLQIEKGSHTKPKVPLLHAYPPPKEGGFWNWSCASVHVFKKNYHNTHAAIT